MGIKVIQSMDVRASVPLDSRAVVQNLTDLPQYKLYEGLLVYQRSNKKYYKCSMHLTYTHKISKIIHYGTVVYTK